MPKQGDEERAARKAAHAAARKVLEAKLPADPVRRAEQLRKGAHVAGKVRWI